MRRKSRFLTFLLSFAPGLSHLYLGYGERGFIYLIILGIMGMGSLGLGFMLSTEEPVIIGFFIYCILWLVALIDAFSVFNIIRYGKQDEIGNDWNREETREFNKKIITLALSMIPGAGHMYLGYQKKGLVFMGGFFFVIFFMGWLNLSFLLFLLPLIWFYSFFDAFHTLSGNKVEDIEIDFSKILPTIKHEHIGIGLIGLGLIIIFQKIFHPLTYTILSTYFDYPIIYQVRNYIQASILSFIFILGGIRMLRKEKAVVEEVEEDEENED